VVICFYRCRSYSENTNRSGLSIYEPEPWLTPTGLPENFKPVPSSTPKGFNDSFATDFTKRVREARDRILGERPQLRQSSSSQL
jgi:hypothetical protein